MTNWISAFKNSAKETKWFVFTCVSLGIIVLGVSAFAFLRLAF